MLSLFEDRPHIYLYLPNLTQPHCMRPPRTPQVTPQNVTVGAGGAVIALSEVDDEYDEMLLKATSVLGALGHEKHPGGRGPPGSERTTRSTPPLERNSNASSSPDEKQGSAVIHDDKTSEVEALSGWRQRRNGDNRRSGGVRPSLGRVDVTGQQQSLQ